MSSTKRMIRPTSKFLVAGAALSGIAALLHLACLIVGAPMFRLMGAGEQMVQLYAAGHWYPVIVTSAVAAVLLAWSAYALSGAGMLIRLPFTRTALCLITAAYIVRGVAFLPAMSYFPGNSMVFWVVSSATCLAIGVVHVIGLQEAWPRLSGQVA